MHSQDLNKARSRGRGLSFLLFLSFGLGPVTRLDAGGLGHQAWWPVKVSQCRTGKVQGLGGEFTVETRNVTPGHVGVSPRRLWTCDPGADISKGSPWSLWTCDLR